MKKNRIAYIHPIDHTMGSELSNRYKALMNKKHEGDAGLDLFYLGDMLKPKHSFYKMALGIKVVLMDMDETQDGYTTTHPVPYMLVPRSSTAEKYGIMQANGIGIVDAGYRGELSVPCVLIGDEGETITRFDRLFQIVQFDGRGVDSVVVTDKDLSSVFPSSRDVGGFGSTGK